VSRASKGTVTVESVRGRLRLRLPRHAFSGQQRYLILHLSDTQMNRKVATAKAQTIEADIALEKFDRTLKKYTTPYAPSDAPPLIEIWDKYATWKRPQVSDSTFGKDYRKTRNHILSLPTQTISRATEIRNWLGANLSPDSARRVLTQVKAAIAWAMDEGIINADPFLGLKIRERKQRGEKREPFTPTERDQILEAFKHEAPHYLPYVEFLFLTGCRTSEANGLRWDDVGEAIAFHQARIEGKDKEGLKTQKSRKFPINTQLRELMGRTAPSNINGEYVFRTESGSPIDGHNFLNKVWRPLVRRLPIPYRPQYSTRHTFITECLAAGIPIATIAAWVGNSPKTIYSHYAGADPAAAPPKF